LLKGDPTTCAAVAIAGQAIARGLDPVLLSFVSAVGDVVHRFGRQEQPVLARDARTGAYTGALLDVLDALRPSVPPFDDEALRLVLDTLWQAMHGSLTPPEPGGMRALKRASR